jgi:hypothetical protein
VVHGEPGVGKTALLEYVAGHAPSCRVARAAGVQSEMELAFAGLRQIRRIRREFPLEVEGGDERLAQTVPESLRLHITDGEWKDIKSSMPKDLAAALPSCPLATAAPRAIAEPP